MSEPDGMNFVTAARQLLARAGELPPGVRREAAEHFVVMAQDWLRCVAETGDLDPVAYEHLVAQLDQFPRG